MRTTQQTSKVRTLNFGEHFIEHVVDELLKDGSRRDFSRTAVVFGGKRPSLFVKRELAQRLKVSFYPPRFYSIDELITTIIRKKENFQVANDLDQSYQLYRLTQQHCPRILKGRETFAQFLPWTREILAFIDQLDLEDVSDERLRNIEANAEIGYAVPEDINRLLESIVILRGIYHRYMQETKIYSRGFQYRRAAELVGEARFSEFDEMIFCNFFYFNRSEATVVQNLAERGLARFIFQGDQDRWPNLQHAAKLLGEPIREQNPRPLNFDLKLYSAFDGHSQVAMAREILKTIPRPDKTVIVLPDPGLIIPLVSEVNPLLNDFNISMGYPLKRSSLYSLLDFIFKAQLSRDENEYYTRDYLRVLRHPLMKNLNLTHGPVVTRVLIHTLEEILTGMSTSEVTGNIFIDLAELFSDDHIFTQAQETLKGMGVAVSLGELKDVLFSLNHLAFSSWEHVGSFADFGSALDHFLRNMVQKSPLRNYPLNLKIVDKVIALQEEIQSVSFQHEHFPQEEIFKIFDAKMEREIVAFSGSPLKGLQILGLFETRALNFEQVIILEANEGVLPRLNVYEPLIPREVMITLNLDRLEQEEEIQRYQFMRLISGAKHVHLIYEENAKKEKSRFVEELVWEQERKHEKIGTVPVTYPGFQVRVANRPVEIVKTPPMLQFLRNHRYSASSINTYLRSPVEFYYRYVLGLGEKENLLEEPENRQVGTFVHDLLEQTFKPFVNKKPVIDAEFKLYFQKVLNERFAATFGKGRTADAFLLKSVLDARLHRFLEHEAQSPERQVAELMYIEKRFDDQLDFSCGKINFSYRVDRVDRMKDGTIMILDYKTGSVDPMPRAIETIENMELTRENIRDQVISFQVPLYFQYLDKIFKDQPINAAYYNLRTLEVNTFVNSKMNFERARINAAFQRALDFILREILDPQVPFRDWPA